MTDLSKRCYSLAALAAVLAVAALPQRASAASWAVELACAADYYAYCSKHDPDGPGVRTCMRANGEKLSRRCLNALIAAGEVSKTEVERRSAQIGR